MSSHPLPSGDQCLAERLKILFCSVWDHIQQCSGVTTGFVFKDQSWQAWGPHVVQGIELRSATCKTSTYLLYYSSGPRNEVLTLSDYKMGTLTTDLSSLSLLASVPWRQTHLPKGFFGVLVFFPDVQHGSLEGTISVVWHLVSIALVPT